MMMRLRNSLDHRDAKLLVKDFDVVVHCPDFTGLAESFELADNVD
jgi:molybdopterin/thiamine biosynthesis adenylyltransferase